MDGQGQGLSRSSCTLGLPSGLRIGTPSVAPLSEADGANTDVVAGGRADAAGEGGPGGAARRGAQ